MRKIPMRKCLATNQTFEKKQLLRIVKTNKNEIVVDVTGKLNGRGAYISKSLEALEILKKKNLLEKIFELKIDESIYKQIEEVINGK